jgi:hypothetical protein
MESYKSNARKVRISSKTAAALKKQLPLGASAEIAKALNISQRMVHYILAGKFADNHGVIPMAMAHIKADKARIKALLAALN